MLQGCPQETSSYACVKKLQAAMQPEAEAAGDCSSCVIAYIVVQCVAGLLTRGMLSSMRDHLTAATQTEAWPARGHCSPVAVVTINNNHITIDSITLSTLYLSSNL